MKLYKLWVDTEDGSYSSDFYAASDVDALLKQCEEAMGNLMDEVDDGPSSGAEVYEASWELCVAALVAIKQAREE